MFKLLIISTVLMVVAAVPSFQLLSSLPSEETISLPSLIPQEQPATASASSSSSEESAEAPAATGEPPAPPTQSPPPTPSEPTASSSSTTSANSNADIEPPSPLESLSADELDLLSSAALGTSPLATSIQHQILPPETIALPIRITTSPGLRTVLAPETIRIHQPTVTKVGELVQKIPTAVSHQSQTVVHKHAEIITPIVAPAVRTITSQVVRAYHTPLVYAAHAPVIKLIQH